MRRTRSVWASIRLDEVAGRRVEADLAGAEDEVVGRDGLAVRADGGRGAGGEIAWRVIVRLLCGWLRSDDASWRPTNGGPPTRGARRRSPSAAAGPDASAAAAASRLRSEG